MTKTSKTIIFFGTDNFSATALLGLINSGYKITAVVTKPDSKSGRGHKINFPEVKKIALANNIDVWQPEKVSEINPIIAAIDNEKIGILSSYGKIIPQKTIDLFDYGIINIHPSLLPKYRGSSPIESAIINGDTETGVSIMLLEAGLDSGPVFGQVKYPLNGKETRPELYEKLSELGTQKLIELLPSVIDGTVKPTVQDDSMAVYCQRIEKTDGFIEPQNISADQAERLIRGHLGYPKSKMIINNTELIIISAHVAQNKNSKLDIEFKNGKYLSIDNLIAPSGRKMSASDYINGYMN